MADVKISALGAISAVAGEDLVAIVDDPSGTPASRKATITQIATFINASAVTAGSTTTFTAKSIDVDNNTITNIEVDNLKSGVLDTDLSSVSGSDDTIASAKAVKTYVDAQIATEDTISELNDTTISSVGDNELLQYNSSSSVWENQTLAEAGISPVAGSSSIVTTGTIGTGTWQGTAIASAYIAGDAIVASKIADNAIDSEHYTDGSIDLAHMSVNSIDSDQYVDASIDLAHLASDSVNGTKIADDSIDSEHIVDGSVDLAHMSVNSIDSDQYVDGSIDLIHLSANSVDSNQYVDGSIDLVHLSANSVDSDQYVDGSIDLAHLSVNSVDSDQYVDGSIDLIHMSDNSVDSDQYVDGSIDVAHMSANSVDSDQYVDASIDSAHLSTSLTINDPTLTFSINTQTGTTYTPVLADSGKIVTLNNGSAITLTIPPNSSVAYPVGSSLTFISIGAGLTTFAQGSGVTIASAGGTATAPIITAQHNSATAIKIATNTWQVIGALT
jgi:hypothetical protein